MIFEIKDGYGGGDETFAERNAHETDAGAEIFKEWCRNNDYAFYRIGLDPKVELIPYQVFRQLPKDITEPPDYLLIDKGTYEWRLVEVKGSPILKAEEFPTLARRRDKYGGPRYRYAYCYQKQIAILTAIEVWRRYEASTDIRYFPSDHKEHRGLDLSDLWRPIRGWPKAGEGL